MTRPTRRPGFGLTEVLVTLFILAIAMVSVLAMFPAATVTMSQALADDRRTACANAADGQIRDFHQRYVVEVGEKSAEQYFTALDADPDGTPSSGPGAPAPDNTNKP